MCHYCSAIIYIYALCNCILDTVTDVLLSGYAINAMQTHSKAVPVLKSCFHSGRLVSFKWSSHFS